MPARNVEKTIERLLTKFYPDISGSSRADKAQEIDAWLRGKLGPFNKGYSTRELEKMYQDENTNDPKLVIRPKLGTEKRVNQYYVIDDFENRISTGPYTKLEIEFLEVPAGFSVITATAADRKGYLRRYLESKNEKETE